MAILDVTDEPTILEKGELMHPIDLEPFVLNEIRMQTRSAAAASKQAPTTGAPQIDVPQLEALINNSPNAQQQVHPAADGLARMLELAEEANEPLPAGELGQQSVYFDELMVCMAGLSVAHERDERDILPDPTTWEEVMSMPDWKEWRKAGREE
eukprot:1836654-Rhodomonas_salina.1